MKNVQLEIENIKYNYAISHCPDTEYPPIFFINGAFQNMHSWAFLSTMLSDHFTIIVADLPGWGSADLLPSNYDFSFLASSVNKILENEGIDQVNLISTSYGSLIATAFAENYTAKVANLMLCSPLLKMCRSLTVLYSELLEIITTKNASLLNDFLSKVGLLNHTAGSQGKIDHFEKLIPLFNRKISKLSDNEFINFMNNTDRILSYGNADLAAISMVKTTVVTGEFDSFTTPEDCRQVAQSFTSSSYESIERADHMFLFERPSAFAESIFKFVCQFEMQAEMLRA